MSMCLGFGCSILIKDVNIDFLTSESHSGKMIQNKLNFTEHKEKPIEYIEKTMLN